ncbi:MAG: hypothetical protein NXI29_10325 [bacterium]|nr:hypothetical protein [bacterium]
MSLRMNLYGCDLHAILNALGSQNQKLLEQACEQLSQVLDAGPECDKVQGWIQTLIETGPTLRLNRPVPEVPQSGDLLTCQMETELHVVGLDCLVKALRKEEHLNLAGESSFWNHGIISDLQQELSGCQFKPGNVDLLMYFNYFTVLSQGTPLFGDDFRSRWSYYTIIPHSELNDLLVVLQEALAYERSLPETMPEELRQHTPTQLTDEMASFVKEFLGWLTQLEQHEQDLYLLWS